MEGIQQGEFSAILFDKIVIEAGEFQLDSVCVEGVLLIVTTLLHLFLRVEHRCEGLHVGAGLRVVEHVVHCRSRFEIDSSGLVECGLFNRFLLHSKLTKPIRIVSSVAIFPHRRVPH